MKKILFLSLVLVGCAPFQPPPPPAPRTGTVVDVSFSKAWDAVIDIFSEKNIPIKTMDRSSGLIVAEIARVNDNEYSDPSIKNWNNCGGWGQTLRVYANRVTYNIVVRGDSTRSTVRANFLWEHKGQGQYATDMPCSTTGYLESEWEKRIAEIARSK
jgi:hypothetical protein